MNYMLSGNNTITNLVNLAEATEIIKNGGIVIYPTDTAFGIGCRIDSREAIKRLYKIRNRPTEKAMPVLVSSIVMSLKYFDNPSAATLKLMDKYWPGALTIVSFCRKNLINVLVRGGGDTVGLRMPSHDIPLNIINSLGLPITGSSANFHGGVTPFKISNLETELTNLVDGVVTGETSDKLASTVVDCTSEPFQVIRQGSVYIK
jgi:L-threonylcarbamoyladenylate synthase